MKRTRRASLFVSLLATLCLVAARPAPAITIGPDFQADYNFTNLGQVPDLPENYGGLVFKAGDPDTLIIGGGANTLAGRLYEVRVVRGVDGHITGFDGTAIPIGSIGEYNDGGVAYGRGGVLFTAQYSVNRLGQTLPDGTDENRIDALAPFGVAGRSISALNFVPAGFANAGAMKIVTFAAGNWYDVSLTPDGTGTFDIAGITQIDLDPGALGVQSLAGGPEGFVYISAGNAAFANDSLLVSEYSANKIGAYEIDEHGNPIRATRRDFITGLVGAEGAAIDPVTGDFLFSTFGVSNEVIAVGGFLPPTPVPLPPAYALCLGALLCLVRRVRKSPVPMARH